jgi:hypothetical protein
MKVVSCVWGEGEVLPIVGLYGRTRWGAKFATFP